MPQAFRNTFLTLRDLIVSAGPLAFLAVGLLVLAYWWLNPNPPKTVTLATGPAQSAYEESVSYTHLTLPTTPYV